VPLGKTPSGNTEICEVKIFGQKYSLMSTEKEHHPFNTHSIPHGAIIIDKKFVGGII